MIVCSCHAVTDREIRRAARSGAQTPGQVAESCGAGASCGGCRETVRDLLTEVHAERALPAPRARFAARQSAPA